MMYDYLPSRLNIRCIPEENSAFDQRMSFRTDIRNRISTSGPTTYDSMEKIIMICIHYKNKHPPLIAVCTYIMYTTTSIIHLAKRAFIHYFYIYLMQFIGTCSVLREQKKRCQVSGVRCQLSGCRVGGSRAQTHNPHDHPEGSATIMLEIWELGETAGSPTGCTSVGRWIDTLVGR